MAIKYLSNISLEGNELQNVKIHPVGTAPTNGQGKLYYDTATNKLMANNGSSWYSVNGSLEDLTSGNTSRITIGGTAAAPTVDVVTGAIVDGGTGLATQDAIYDFVTSQVGAVPSETVTSLGLSSNVLTYTDENGADTDIDLSLYLDDSNLARLTSGSINGSTGVATFTRDDASTFTIDMSAFLDGITVNNTLTSTSTSEGLSAAQGKVLKDLIDALPTQDTNTQLSDSDIAAFGYIKDYTPTEAEVTAHEAALTIGYGQLTGTPTIPTNNNQLTNGENYVTGVDFDEIGGTQSDLNLSGFTNDLTLAPANAEQNVQSDWNATSGDALILNKPSLFDGAYSSLSGKPTIPTNNNQLTNGSNYISDYTVTQGDVTAHQAALSITESQISDLSHFSGSYNDLTDVPSNLGAQNLSIAGNTLSLDGGGNSVDIYDQTLATTDDVEFRDITSSNKILAEESYSGTTGAPHATIKGLQTTTAKGSFNIAMYGDSTSTGSNEAGYNYGSYSRGHMAGSNGYDGVIYGAYNEAKYSGSDPNGNNASWSSAYGTQSVVKVTGTGDLGYVIGDNVSAVIDNAGADVEYLQGQHTTVDLKAGHISGSAATMLLDADYTAATIDGDFAYLQIQNDTLPTPSSGTARAINSDSTLPSKFDGLIESTSFVKTGGTSSQFLKADGSVDSSTYITSAALPTDVSELNNDSGFISGYTVTSGDVTAHEGDITITESQISDLSHFSGSYNDLTNKPTIPTINTASTTVAGIVELATNTEAKAGTMTNRAVTPQGALQLADQQIAADKVNVTVGNGSATTLTATHNFGNKKCLVSVTEVATGDEVYVEVIKNTNDVSLIFASAPATNAYEVSMFKMS